VVRGKLTCHSTRPPTFQTSKFRGDSPTKREHSYLTCCSMDDDYAAPSVLCETVDLTPSPFDNLTRPMCGSVGAISLIEEGMIRE